VAGIRDQSLAIGYVRNLAGWLGMEPTEVQRAVSARRASAPPRPSDAAEPMVPAESVGGPSLMSLPTDPTTRLERDAIMAILQYPNHVGADLARRTVGVSFSDATLSVVRDAIAASLEQLDAPDWVARVSAEVPAPYVTLVTQLGVAPIPERPELMATYCRGVTSALIDRDLLRQKRELLGTMQRTDAAADPERYAHIQRELVRVETERRALREE
jgi:DNA primase